MSIVIKTYWCIYDPGQALFLIRSHRGQREWHDSGDIFWIEKSLKIASERLILFKEKPTMAAAHELVKGTLVIMTDLVIILPISLRVRTEEAEKEWVLNDKLENLEPDFTLATDIPLLVN